jgi:hypothetical protein
MRLLVLLSALCATSLAAVRIEYRDGTFSFMSENDLAARGEVFQSCCALGHYVEGGCSCPVGCEFPGTGLCEVQIPAWIVIGKVLIQIS